MSIEAVDLDHCGACDVLTNDAVPCAVCVEFGDDSRYCGGCVRPCPSCNEQVCYEHFIHFKKVVARCVSCERRDDALTGDQA